MSVSESYFKGKLNYKGYKRFFFKKIGSQNIEYWLNFELCVKLLYQIKQWTVFWQLLKMVDLEIPFP